MPPAKEKQPAFCKYCQKELVNPKAQTCRDCLSLANAEKAKTAVPKATKLPLPCNVGSMPEKLEVLCQRAAAGEYLWHPLDRNGNEDEVAR